MSKKNALQKYLFFVASAALSVSAQAASFDCTKAHSFSERVVCNDPQYSVLDDKLAASYAKAYAAAADRRAIAAVRDQEWRWRQIHCRDTACVAAWYTRRIAELEADYDARGDSHNAAADTLSAAPPAVGLQKVPPVDAGLSALSAAQASSERAVSSEPNIVTESKTDGHSGGALGPLPSAASDVIGQSGRAGDFQLTPVDTHALLLSGAATESWPALPPLPSPSISNPSSIRMFNKGERTSERTIGVFVDF